MQVLWVHRQHCHPLKNEAKIVLTVLTAEQIIISVLHFSCLPRKVSTLMAGIIALHDTTPRAKFKCKAVVTKANAAFLGQLPPIKTNGSRGIIPFEGSREPLQQKDPNFARAIDGPAIRGHHDSFLNRLDGGFHSGVGFIQQEAEEAVKAVEETVDAATHVIEDAAVTIGEAMSHIGGNIRDVITRKSSSIKYAPGEEPHEDYSETCLFIRKLKTGMHFELFGKNGKKQHCALLLSANNSALQWHVGSKQASYRFEDLVKVDTLEDSDSFRRAVRARLHEPRESESCWFTLVFRVAAEPQAQVKRTKPSSVSPSDLDTQFFNIELSANSTHDRNYAVRGFELMRLHHGQHEDTHGSLGSKTSAPLTRILKFTHHLYRPHHDSNCPPARWHDGTIVEVAFDSSYDIIVSQRQINGKSVAGTRNRLALPCAVFQEGMFLRAKVISFDGGEAGGHYQLGYKDGPYSCDEEPSGDLLLLRMLPQGAVPTDIVLINVKPTFISVDMDDNFRSEPPFLILGISCLQLFIFLYYVFTESNGVADAISPVAGPEELWMKAVAPFPLCSDLRSEVWRLVSYQLVHAGIQHIGFNMVMQLIFGLPLNMVHGSIRFGFIYQLGVIGGALAFAVIDGAHGAVVGCSGGVYCIFGMHLAEVIMNGDADNKGILNK